jgi:CheY-like chemotaxis protein
LRARTEADDGVRVKVRILVVDDSRHFRRTAGELLVARGFELLDAVTDGEEALELISRACPDGVLLDINLPGRDGFAVAASLAAACPATRIVLTSSDIDAVPDAVLKDCGATAFVAKTELATTDLVRLFAKGSCGRGHRPGRVRPEGG